MSEDSLDAETSAEVARTAFAARYFPNVSVRAYYSPHSLAVFMPKDEIEKGWQDNADYYRGWLIERLPVLTHEFQHALDHVGSVAGRNLLDKLNSAYFAIERKGDQDISEMGRLIELHDAERAFDRKAYFTEFDADYRWLSDERPRWRWTTSAGFGFDHFGRPNPEDPLFFVRFNDDDQRAYIARQPLTAAALFETRAVYAELEQETNIAILTARDQSTALDEFHRKQQRLLYEPSLVLYSAPAHFASSHCTNGDVLAAYKIAAYAAGIVLNLVPGLQFVPNIHPIFEHPNAMPRLELLRDRKDPGFLYALLIVHAPPYQGDIHAWLDMALAAAGFPTRETIMKAAYDYLAIPTRRTGGWFDLVYFRAISAGAVNFARLRERCGLLDFEAMGAFGTKDAPIALPHTFLKNDVVPSPVEALVELPDQLDLLEAEVALAEQTDEFLRACR